MSDLFEVPRLFITNTGPLSRLEVGGEFDVANASRPVGRLLELTGLNPIGLAAVDKPDSPVGRRPLDRCVTSRRRLQVDSGSLEEGVRDVDRQARERLVG